MLKNLWLSILSIFTINDCSDLLSSLLAMFFIIGSILIHPLHIYFHEYMHYFTLRLSYFILDVKSNISRPLIFRNKRKMYVGILPKSNYEYLINNKKLIYISLNALAPTLICSIIYIIAILNISNLLINKSICLLLIFELLTYFTGSDFRYTVRPVTFI